MADEGFREIQLNGKQLIFLFMTLAVVLVVTFLCGVLVGRGVRAQKEPTVAAEAEVASPGAADPTASLIAQQPVAKAAPQVPPSVPPPSPEEDYSYYARLEGRAAPAEAAKPEDGTRGGAVREKPAPKDAKATANPTAKDVPAATTPAPAPPDPTVSGNAETAGVAWALKIAAYREKAQADALASRLSAKGYSTFVVPMTRKGSPLFSVQVGKFKTRKEADAAKRRLEKEEQFKPLLTR
jgi:cell division septation protein DedD